MMYDRVLIRRGLSEAWRTEDAERRIELLTHKRNEEIVSTLVLLRELELRARFTYHVPLTSCHVVFRLASVS